jgi:hypothetical protein
LRGNKSGLSNVNRGEGKESIKRFKTLKDLPAEK